MKIYSGKNNIISAIFKLINAAELEGWESGMPNGIYDDKSASWNGEYITMTATVGDYDYIFCLDSLVAEKFTCDGCISFVKALVNLSIIKKDFDNLVKKSKNNITTYKEISDDDYIRMMYVIKNNDEKLYFLLETFKHLLK